MHKNSEIYKNLSLGLFYPAILGSIIYNLFTIMEQSNKSTLEKEIILIILLILLIFDYLHRHLNIYTLATFIYDLFLLFGIYMIYTTLNIFELDKGVDYLHLGFYTFFMVGFQTNWELFSRLFKKIDHRKDTSRGKRELIIFLNTVQLGLSMLIFILFLKSTFPKNYMPLASIVLLILITILQVLTYFMKLNELKKSSSIAS